MQRAVRALVALMVLTTTALGQPGPRRGAAWGRSATEYDGRFTFVRVRWDDGGGGRRFGMSSAWNHDYPRAEQNLTMLLDELTLIDTRTDGSLILTLDDPAIFRYPVLYMWEPGFWTMNDGQAASLRDYLRKGGFIIFDDFEGDQWNNLEDQMRRVLPAGRWVKLDRTHAIFDSFFRMKTIDFPHPMYGYHPSYYGLFEDNDPSRRLLAIANHDNDVAEYFEFFGTGLFPVDPSNEAYKLGVNYMLYALTH